MSALPPEAMDAEPPKVSPDMLTDVPPEIIVERYAVQRELGRKRGRRTVLCQDLHSQQQVVVKILSFGDALDWDDVRLFEREAGILQHLDHPGIPKYLAHYERPDQQQQLLVQTYLPAPSLQQLLDQQHHFREADLRAIAHAVLDILIYLHSYQPPVIHRDLKPSNLLRDQDGTIYLVDFGSVQVKAAAEGSTFTVVGTYGFMPPEQFGGRTVPASDLYSLGATLVTLATGIPPSQLPQQDLRPQFESLVSLSPGLVRWLQQLLDPRLERRFSSAQEAKQALFQSDGLIPYSRSGTSLGGALSPPGKSPLRIHRTANGYDIVVPSQGSLGTLLITGLFALAWNAFVLTWTGAALLRVPGLLKVFFVVFSLPFWSVGLTLLQQVIFGLFGRTRLSLNGTEVDRSCEALGVRVHRPGACLRSELTHVQISPHSPNPPRHIEVLANAPLSYQVELWARSRAYTLTPLTQAEAEWLGSWLSQELGIPLKSGDPSQRLPK
ncbi:MAG: serine/threonine-protein kinase [Synechococcales cyanobacterium]